jgi:adenylylsulfate kinase-like enzyme
MRRTDAADTGWYVWIAGLPGSGKSVVSAALLTLLCERGVEAQLLSSDGLRKVMTPKSTHSLEERDAVLRDSCVHCSAFNKELCERHH